MPAERGAGGLGRVRIILEFPTHGVAKLLPRLEVKLPLGNVESERGFVVAASLDPACLGVGLIIPANGSCLLL